MDFYLAGRQNYVCDKVTLGGPFTDITLPPDFKILTKELISQMRYFVTYLPVIDPRSFPLRKLFTQIEEPAHFDHPILRSVDELEIEDGYDGMLPFIDENITSKTVVFSSCDVPHDDVLKLIRNWEKNGKELGTTYKFDDYKAGSQMSTMCQLKKKLSEFKNKRYNGTTESPFLIIPIDNTTSCINVYSTGQTEEFETILKVEHAKQKRQKKQRSEDAPVTCKKAKR
ncbi:hypothetical protein GCK72_022450 [Caenorhabditis remanei]|uniref:F-box associated domain-containing protein n=1 Tax=Caenorhabditis remanei TaxID=31234 RepID=A0A6A5FU36_CAERE|nr:hypothetical protein GCK72_022450 [Caenorhabditis remanei]KAF1745999.1 hypothetical protein GCK72_022450 [Caenorhabditis remanei]